MTKDERRTRIEPAGWTTALAARLRRAIRTKIGCACAALVFLQTGCVSASSWDWLPWKKNETVAEKPATPRDGFLMRGAGLERDRVADSALEADLEAAKRQFQNKEYKKAEAVCHKIANNKKAPINLIDDALYYEAECQRLQNNLRSAEGTFRKYTKEFRNGQHTEEANRRLFDIANYWLDDTRAQMAAWEEKREGKRWFIMPSSYFHISSDKPFSDMEGHALQLLEEVGLNDIRGSIRTVDGGPSLGERALFFLATVKFFREDYREADHYYGQLYENHPNSPLAPKAIKQSIICKQVMHGGTAYDTRTIEESRKLIDRYQGAYPEWTKDGKWLSQQLGGIHLQQADRDFKIAEFYRRTGHPGSAYFYYELVRRRYPNTDYARKSDEQMRDLRGLAERDTGTIASNTAPKTPITETTPNAFTPSGTSAGASLPPLPSGGAPTNLPPPPGSSVPTRPSEVTTPGALPAGPFPNVPLNTRDRSSGAATPVAPPTTSPSEPPPPLPVAPTTPLTPRLLPSNLQPGGN